MPPIRQKIPLGPNGPFKEAELVEVVESQERSNNYKLSDGSVVSLKIVVNEIWKVDGEYDQDGNPLYIIRSGNLATVTAPEELRKKTS